MGSKKYSRKYWQGIGVAFIVMLVMAPAAFGATIYWTDWTSATIGHPGSADGTITPASGSVTVGYHGELQSAQTTAGGTYYWGLALYTANSEISNAPPTSDILQQNLASADQTVNTITFSHLVENPVMAIVSLGQNGLPVFYSFDSPFIILSFGPGYWGGPGTLSNPTGNILRGDEGNGVIQFLGTYSSISWSNLPDEYWHGFTFGIEDVAPVPEPGTMMLLGSGLVGLAGWGRKKFRK